MATVNENFLMLSNNYLFADIAKKVKAYREAHPDERVISLGIGDVTRPLVPSVIEAMHRAVDEMASGTTFRGYGPEHGYDFLREAIIRNDYEPRGVSLDPSEVFVNDGAKSDTGNFGDILGTDNSVAITDPVYPVYLDSNCMSGRAGKKTERGFSNISYMPASAENSFVPALPERRADMIYLCYPNNPTGTVLTRSQLERWVSYALENDSLILYDSAYESFIREDGIPHTIYEIPGAKKCAVEFRSYSKTAGFTGVRCGYTVIPKELTVRSADGQRVALNHLWERRQCTKFNGASYISQRAAEAIYTPAGKAETRAVIDYYMENARLMRETLTGMGFEVFGGRNAPYLWVKTPKGISSWEMFDILLSGAKIVCTPGVGFGPSGEGYVRFTAFGNREDCIEAMERLRNVKF